MKDNIKDLGGVTMTKLLRRVQDRVSWRQTVWECHGGSSMTLPSFDDDGHGEGAEKCHSNTELSSYSAN